MQVVLSGLHGFQGPGVWQPVAALRVELLPLKVGTPFWDVKIFDPPCTDRVKLLFLKFNSSIAGFDAWKINWKQAGSFQGNTCDTDGYGTC